MDPEENIVENIETPVDDNIEQENLQIQASDEAPSETPPEPKPRKTAEEVLKGRVGHLTKTLSSKDQELADTRAKLAAAEALLNNNRSEVSEGTPPHNPSQPNKTYTEADFEAAVAMRAEIEAFNRKADEMYNEGSGKFQDWKDTVDTLVASGFMNKDLLDAAMAIDGGPDVIHYLGTNLDEAERINSLSPIRKAAEMAKLSASLNTPVPVSSAPAPIRPVSGSPSPSVDLQRIADSDDMRSYIAARAKQGSPWAQSRK